MGILVGLKLKIHIMTKFTFILTLLLFAFTVNAQELVVKDILTPPTKQIKQSIQKRSKVWIPAQWNIENNQYVWSEGKWENKKVGQVFISGGWEKAKGGFVWTEGYWKNISINKWMAIYS
jgi:hypothetical protein